jgi:ComF family protein
MGMGLSISGTARAAWRAGLAALLPQDCLLCGQPSGDALLCPDCHAGLPRPSDPRCPVCALPAPGGAICGACLRQPPAFDATVAAFVYAFPVDKLVQQLKFSHRLAIADFLAAALADAGLPRADALVPVPLSPRRLQERGFNQAAEIARALGRIRSLPLAPTACRRQLETPPQSSLPWKERQRNVRGAFACDVDVSGKTVIVVDDVMTTGATLGELARVLKGRGAARVVNCVAARAGRDRH